LTNPGTWPISPLPFELQPLYHRNTNDAQVEAPIAGRVVAFDSNAPSAMALDSPMGLKYLSKDTKGIEP
jgi:hypothetical protein